MRRFRDRSAAAMVWALSCGLASAQFIQPPEIPGLPQDPLARALARELFKALPAEHQSAILATTTAHTDQATNDDGVTIDDPRADRLAPALRRRSDFARLTEPQIDLLLGLLEEVEAGRPIPAFCVAEDADPALAFALEELYRLQTPQFQQTSRWTTTALAPSSSAQGTPTIITYSFVPDGTAIAPFGSTRPGGPSTLFRWLNGIYGSPAVWQDLFHQTFERWGDLINVTYVFEPNDDGVQTNSLPGVVGVRGDVRICAYLFEGNGGVLAYNNFPNDGDMVFDAFDSFYSTLSSNSLRLRNVIAHEHGHGLGMLHVCPRNQTKLMEPSVSTLFNGPQLDDILNGQRHYGDLNEPNDTTAFATEMGFIGFGTTASDLMVSVDDNSDVDLYRVTITEPVNLRIRATPAAANYLQGPQTDACDTGAPTDYNRIHDLRLRLLDSTGLEISAFNNDPLGAVEDARVLIEQTGVYFIEVAGGTTNSIQLYDFSLVGEDPSFFPASITNPTITPDIQPGDLIVVGFDFNPGSESVLAGPFVAFDYGLADRPAGIVQAVLTGGTTYQATLSPADCGDRIQISVSATTSVSGAQIQDITPQRVAVGDLPAFLDTGDNSAGWTVSGTVATGAAGRWEQGIPAGGGLRADPPTDNGALGGGGGAWLTGNSAGNTDVDDGQTILTTPAFNGTAENATVSYARWYSNDTGNAPGADVFVVEISNGGAFVPLEIVGPTGPGTTGGWISVTYTIADFITPSTQMRLRFIVDDAPDGSLIEAAIDDLTVSGEPCPTDVVIAPCNPADLSTTPPETGEFGSLDGNDISSFVSAFIGGQPMADLSQTPPVEGVFGTFDGNDISAFVGAFVAGCP